MGDCRYYLKASFPEPLTETQRQELTSFFEEDVYAATVFWQKCRNPDMAAVFWANCAAKWPLVKDYLGDLHNPGALPEDWEYLLAGHLSINDFDDCSLEITEDGRQLMYDAMVWRLGTWDRLGGWLRERYGAGRVAWISEEDVNPYDVLEAMT